MDHLPSAACCCVLLPKWREPLRPQQAWRTASAPRRSKICPCVCHESATTHTANDLPKFLATLDPLVENGSLMNSTPIYIILL
jgi:hypothetical protein